MNTETKPRAPASGGVRGLINQIFRQHIKFWLALATGVIFFVLAPTRFSGIGRVLVAWNATVLLLLPLTYIWMRRLDSRQLRERYRDEDPTAPVILLVVVTASLLSVLAIVVFLSTLKHVPPGERLAHLVLAAVTIADSWLIVPTMYTLHYADAYYSADPQKPPLSFPQTTEPVFWDFVYFSFTIAAACQTADVATTDVSVRRSVVVHSVISFLFNASILGFAINVSAGLVGGN
jgi:uncharacterized membrane protein